MAPIDIGGLQHTQWHIDCPACEYARDHSLGDNSSSHSLTFADAAQRWLDLRETSGNIDRGRLVRSNTIRSDKVYIAALKKEFSGLLLNKFQPIHLKLYQEKRRERAGALCINHELQFLKRLLREAGLWTEEMQKSFRLLPVRPPDIPPAMTPEQQAHYLSVCASRKEWQLLYWYSLLALNTTCNSCEIRGLHLGDVNLFQNLVYIRQASAKNKYRQREIPLTDEAVWALERLRERARALGAIHDAHYLLPYSISKKRWDPRRPMTPWGLTRQFEAVRTASGLLFLRGTHDLRHTAITRLAEAGTPIPTIMSIAGHMTRQMMEHYTHVSEAAKRKAVVSSFEAALRPKLITKK